MWIAVDPRQRKVHRKQVAATPTTLTRVGTCATLLFAPSFGHPGVHPRGNATAPRRWINSLLKKSLPAGFQEAGPCEVCPVARWSVRSAGRGHSSTSKRGG